jgi:hypothetical protein
MTRITERCIGWGRASLAATTTGWGRWRCCRAGGSLPVAGMGGCWCGIRSGLVARVRLHDRPGRDRRDRGGPAGYQPGQRRGPARSAPPSDGAGFRPVYLRGQRIARSLRRRSALSRSSAAAVDSSARVNSSTSANDRWLVGSSSSSTWRPSGQRRRETEAPPRTIDTSSTCRCRSVPRTGRFLSEQRNPGVPGHTYRASRRGVTAGHSVALCGGLTPSGPGQYLYRVARRSIGEEPGKHGCAERLRRVPADPESFGDVVGVHQRLVSRPSLRSRSGRSVPNARHGPWAQLRPARCSAAARSR